MPTLADVLRPGLPDDDRTLVVRFCEVYGHAWGPRDLAHAWRVCTRNHGRDLRCQAVLTDAAIEQGTEHANGSEPALASR